jgi:hypothetical protein
MSHGESSGSSQRPLEVVPQPTPSVPTASGSGRRPDTGTSPTISSLSSHEFGPNIGIRPYVAEVDHLISLFRAGERTRFEVISSVTQLLNADAELSPQERAQSFELYMAEISSVPETPRNKGKGRDVPGPSLSKAPGPSLGIEGDRDSGGDDSSGGGSSSSSESGDGEPRKRRKLHLSDMPWSKRKGGAVPQNPSCVKSADLIRRFNRDLKSAKLFIKLAPGAPRGVPMSEWEHIFKGEAVDLDKILSSLHRVTVDSERKASFGDTEISIGSAETKRKVETSSEWSTSWRSASRAIAFVFEHREQELAEYGDYIERLFAAKRSGSHGQVILFDRGVRNEVGGGQTLLLTDYHYFTSLYAATLQDDGVEYNRNRRGGGGGKPGGAKDEVCLRFNGQAGCRFSDSACKYKHSCLGCGQSGHGRSACDKAK